MSGVYLGSHDATLPGIFLASHLYLNREGELDFKEF